MKGLIQICFMFFAAVSAVAQQPKIFRGYDWNTLMAQHPVPNSQIVSIDGVSVLKIEVTNDTPLTFSILKITNSSLIRKVSSISWEMKYEKVVERWQNFTNNGGTSEGGFFPSSQPAPPGTGENVLGAALILFYDLPPLAAGGDERIFPVYVQGQEDEGSAKYLSGFYGTSNWKPYEAFIFHASPSEKEAPPDELDLHLFLAGTGTVYLRPIKLIGITSTWWSPQLSALLGGIGGSLVGCLGGLIGVLAGMGKARRFVLGMTRLLIALGILLTTSGIVAVASKQPYAVWYPLILLGGILTLVCGANLYPITKRYDDQEIRRMTSMDATGR